MQPEHDAAAAAEVDPLKAVADAMDAAVQAAHDGAQRARISAAEAWPAASEFLTKAIYNTSYAVSYGVVFPVALIARTIPKENAFVHGLTDGARAAYDALQSSRGEPAGETPQPVNAPA